MTPGLDQETHCVLSSSVSLKEHVLFSLVGFKQNLSLLDILFLLFSRRAKRQTEVFLSAERERTKLPAFESASRPLPSFFLGRRVSLDSSQFNETGAAQTAIRWMRGRMARFCQNETVGLLGAFNDMLLELLLREGQGNQAAGVFFNLRHTYVLRP